MAASITSITKPAPFTWRFAWTGTSPFYVIRKGRLVFVPSTTKTQHIFDHDDNEEPPVIEVYDSTQSSSAAQQLVHPPYMQMQWYHADYANYYIAQYEETVGSVSQWVDRPPLIIDKGVGYYFFSTPVLDDETDHTWRIIAIDNLGQRNPIEFSLQMVRNPDPPSISLGYNSGTGNLTVSERTT